jgi:hypothetical protein
VRLVVFIDLFADQIIQKEWKEQQQVSKLENLQFTSKTLAFPLFADHELCITIR